MGMMRSRALRREKRKWVVVWSHPESSSLLPLLLLVYKDDDIFASLLGL